MTTPITKEQLTDDVLQDIYGVAVSCEPAEQNGAYMASFDLLCKLDDVGGTAYAIRKLIDMLRAERRKAAMDAEPVGAPDAWLWKKKTGYITAGINRPMYEPLHSAAIPLYAVTPAPVVQCPFPCGWNNLNKLAIQDAAFVSLGLVEGEVVTEAYRQAIIANNDRLLKVIASCRDFMLQGGKS